jgi:hypothetical protein
MCDAKTNVRFVPEADMYPFALLCLIVSQTLDRKIRTQSCGRLASNPMMKKSGALG